METVVTEGQLSMFNMDVAPIKIRGGQDTLQDKIERSYRALRLGSDMSHKYYGEKIMVCYSGGKDSEVILRLAEECLGTDFEVINAHTTVDAPQTVKHIEKTFKRLNEKGIKTIYRNRYPVEVTMWDLIAKKQFPPTRIVRYCCSELKEMSTKNRIGVLGVRSAESTNRQGREVFGIRGGQRKLVFFSLDHAEEVHRESQEINDPAWDCTLIQKAKEHEDLTVNAIYEWTDDDVWDFIRNRNIDINPLYAEGNHRVGCVGCPLARYADRIRDFERFPTYKQAYINAFQRMIDSPTWRNHEVKWKSGEEVFYWWLEYDHKGVRGQMNMFEGGEG